MSSNKMSLYRVKSLSKINTTFYKEGDHFLTNRSLGILLNGKIKTVNMSTPDLTNYVKKEELHLMINDYLNKESGE